MQLLNKEIIRCRACPRLVSYREQVARKKVRRFLNWDYWGRPLPGFGDLNAKLLVIGLAPAAHGGNRTGRMFTGDDSGNWLAKALNEIGFANKPFSNAKDDGLQLKGAYITAVARCAPPDNKPTKEEIENCSRYLRRELQILKNLKVVLTLGKIAFNSYLKHLSLSEKPKFKHGSVYKYEGYPILIASYHPSRQNTQTKKLTWEMWIEVFKKVRELIKN
ncbi:MAG: uracil-DNA glycosylase [Thaumarchaeota archaeon]|nr:uracil-DNA glycosylase [Nitrososphaerota archaeon]